MSEEVLESLTQDVLKLSLVVGALECCLTALAGKLMIVGFVSCEGYLLFYAAYRPVNESSVLIDNSAPFAKRLLDILESTRLSVPNPDTALLLHKVICNSFALLIEGSIRDAEFWDAVKQQTQFAVIINALVLEDTRQGVRNDVSERIKIVCTPSKSPKKVANALEAPQPFSSAEAPARIDMLATIWDALVQVIPSTPDFASQSSEFFKVALWVFQSVTEKSPKDMMFSHYLRQWSEVMFRHRTKEVCCHVGTSPMHR